MTTINWEITKLDCLPQSEGKTDMVTVVYWRCDGMQVEGDQTYKALFSTSTPIPYNPDHHWVEYADLTQAEVLEWIWENGVNKVEIESWVQSSIDSQINPPVVSPALPWA